MESLSAPRFVSATARRHGISRSQLGTWLRTFRNERHGVVSAPAFVPAVIAAPPGCAVQDDETGWWWWNCRTADGCGFRPRRRQCWHPPS
ncbi:transposase [Aureimonas pseudogalii]